MDSSFEDIYWPVTGWQYDVANGDTHLGYRDWVEHNKEVEVTDNETQG